MLTTASKDQPTLGKVGICRHDHVSQLFANSTEWGNDLSYEYVGRLWPSAVGKQMTRELWSSPTSLLVIQSCTQNMPVSSLR